MSDLSVSGSEKEDQGAQIPCTFVIPNQTAGTPELREIAKYKASNPGRKGKKGHSSIKGDDTLGYHTKIITLGKSFGVMVDPWIQTIVFSKNIAPPLATPAQIFKTESDLYNQYLTAALYAHIDEKFHELVDTAVYTDFAHNFLHHLNAQRSSAIHSIKECLPLILLSEKVVPNLEPATIRDLILHPGDDPKTQKCSKFPSILYDGLRQVPANLFMNRVPALALRAVLWGKESVNDKRTRKPASSVVGHMWKIKKVTEGSVALACTAVITHLAGHIRAILEDAALLGETGILRRDRHCIQDFLPSAFHAISTSPQDDGFGAVERTGNVAEVDSDEEMAEALAGLDIEHIPEDDMNPISIFNSESDDAPAEEPAPRPRRPDGARDPAPSVPTTDEDEVDGIPAPVGRGVCPHRVISPIEQEEESDLTASSDEEVAPAAVGG
ncbi:hypothetical protein B0H17DRAFT_1127333 [Mycena rosella]|uniref:Uncharacterized protein n=1 Tax=Mycena rosella TaxID=1033263 RepID=A0AAD7GRL4_MYCRO|nr:hypothetical protein B0H17DRAFT_1127333 [Mycena rosella]